MSENNTAQKECGSIFIAFQCFFFFFSLCCSLYVYVYCQEPLNCVRPFAWDTIKKLCTFLQMSATEILENQTDAQLQGKRGRKCPPVFKVDKVETQQDQSAPNWHLALIPNDPHWFRKRKKTPSYFVYCICQNEKHQQNPVQTFQRIVKSKKYEVGSRDGGLRACINGLL